MCLRASAELRLIDPKINLRVNRDTPLCGLRAGHAADASWGWAFPSMKTTTWPSRRWRRWATRSADARDYAMAACWEFIIPGKGMEIPNIGAMPFANSGRSA